MHVLAGGSDGPTAARLQRFLESVEAAELQFRESLRKLVEEVLGQHHDSFVATLRGIAGERISGGFGTYLAALTYLRPSKLAALLPGARSGEEGLLDGVATSLARRLNHKMVDGLHVYLRRVRAATAAWMLWRRDLIVRWRSLGVDEAVALDAVRAGAAFGEVCELLCEHVDPDGAGMHAASLLKRWLNDGLLTGVSAD